MKDMIRIEYAANKSNDLNGVYYLIDPSRNINAKGEVFYSGQVFNREMQHRNFSNSRINSWEKFGTFCQ